MAIVNAGMSVRLEDGSSTIRDLQVFYGGIGPTVLSASRTCGQLVGRWGSGRAGTPRMEMVLPVSGLNMHSSRKCEVCRGQHRKCKLPKGHPSRRGLLPAGFCGKVNAQ